jgi:hypothetical protein
LSFDATTGPGCVPIQLKRRLLQGDVDSEPVYLRL